MCPKGGGWMDGRSGPAWRDSRLVCHVLLVETPSSGLVLVDTGVGLEDVRDPVGRLGRVFTSVVRPVLAEGETARRRVEALGFDADDVRHVVLTHMDLDHAGGLSDFPSASVHVFRDEHYAATERPTRMERERYRTVQWQHGARFETYDADGEPWHGFAAVRALRGLPEEILILPLTGHSRGHCGVAVESDRGWLLHAGDAYFHADQMNARPTCPSGLTLFQRVVAFDTKKMRASQARLRELVADESAAITVFSAHDETELTRLAATASSASPARSRA